MNATCCCSSHPKRDWYLTQNSSKCLDLVDHCRRNLQETQLIQYHSRREDQPQPIHSFHHQISYLFFTESFLSRLPTLSTLSTLSTGAPWYVRFVPLLRQLFHTLRQVTIQRSVDQGLGGGWICHDLCPKHQFSDGGTSMIDTCPWLIRVNNGYPLVICDSYWKLPFIVSFPIQNGDFPSFC